MDIESLKRKLLVKYPFFGNILAISKFIEDFSIETAETDGKNIYYNPNFLESISLKEQLFVLAYEVCHIAFDHIKRGRNKNKEIWNIATDAVINAFLKKDGLSLIKGVVDIPDAINYDSEEMYEKLLKENENKDVGHDTHYLWDQNNLDKEEISKNSYENDLDKRLQEEIKKCTILGEKEAFKQNKIERRKQLEELQKSLASQSHGYGNDSNSQKRDINNIGIAKPLIDWRLLLKEAVKFDLDWSYQNASIEDGVLTPYLEELPKSETEILLDTSGSIDEALLRNFLRECKNILQSSKVFVGCFDTKFYGFNEIKSELDIDNMPFYGGGGGTDFEVAVNAFSRRVENKIIFTDGKALMPKKTIDAIWIVFGNEKINPIGGKVIYIDNLQLEKLLETENRKR